MSKDILKHYCREGDMFLRCIATGDETWMFHYDVESKKLLIEYHHSTVPLFENLKP